VLEVPGERVTASSAAFALQRVCQLRTATTAGDETDSFVRQAVLHELCETVSLGLPQLASSTLISLAGCAASASANYDSQFIDVVNDEVLQDSYRLLEFQYILEKYWNFVPVLEIPEIGLISRPLLSRECNNMLISIGVTSFTIGCQLNGYVFVPIMKFKLLHHHWVNRINYNLSNGVFLCLLRVRIRCSKVLENYWNFKDHIL
jgi:hypothetical protein